MSTRSDIAHCTPTAQIRMQNVAHVDPHVEEGLCQVCVCVCV